MVKIEPMMVQETLLHESMAKASPGERLHCDHRAKWLLCGSVCSRRVSRMRHWSMRTSFFDNDTIAVYSKFGVRMSGNSGSWETLRRLLELLNGRLVLCCWIVKVTRCWVEFLVVGALDLRIGSCAVFSLVRRFVDGLALLLRSCVLFWRLFDGVHDLELLERMGSLAFWWTQYSEWAICWQYVVANFCLLIVSI